MRIVFWPLTQSFGFLNELCNSTKRIGRFPGYLRSNGMAEIRANSHKLTEIEENSLLNWILSIDLRGVAPRPTIVREIANLLLAARGSTPVPLVGENWVTKFVKRHPELSSRFSRRYNY